jgi:hypothetical protein
MHLHEVSVYMDCANFGVAYLAVPNSTLIIGHPVSAGPSGATTASTVHHAAKSG